MGKKWVNMRNVAVLCGILLIVLSVGAVFRETGGSKDLRSQTSPSQETSSLPEAKPEPQDNTQQVAQEKAEPVKTEATESTKPTAAAAYSYTANPGDSYTAMARDAVKKYIEANKLKATPEQLLNAEVSLANEAGSPMLEVGQPVNIARDTVASAMQNAGVAVAAAPQQTATEKPDNKPDTKPDNQYTAVAENGDSYITIARKAIQQHIETRKQPLSEVQRIAAETKLAEDASWPEIQAGQAVTINDTALRDAVAFATSLDADSRNAWQQYAAAVDL